MLDGLCRGPMLGSRIWIVRAHMQVLERPALLSESEAWETSFRTPALRPRLIPVGPEPLLVIDRS